MKIGLIRVQLTAKKRSVKWKRRAENGIRKSGRLPVGSFLEDREEKKKLVDWKPRAFSLARTSWRKTSVNSQERVDAGALRQREGVQGARVANQPNVFQFPLTLL